MPYKLLFFVSFFILPYFASAQEKFTISGYIKDNSTDSPLSNVKVSVDSDPQINTTSDANGFYSLSLPQGNYEVSFLYESLPEQKIRVSLFENTTKEVKLGENVVSLSEVAVQKKSNKSNQSMMGVEKLSVTTLNKLPVLLGEKDIIKSLQLLPGVTSAGEGQNGFNVRGGAIDQNLILLDDMPIYNSSHLLGFFSTFNSDILKDVTLYKGNLPAQYGGRVSSVVDIKTIDGNDQKISGNGGIGFISSRLTLEIPIKKDKSSLLVSGRRTYADVFLQLSEEFKDNILYFYDFNTKFNYKLTKKDEIFFSGYHGRDKLSLTDNFTINWGNTAFAFRYKRDVSEKLLSNTSFTFSNYDYTIVIDNNNNPFEIFSKINTIQLKQEFQVISNAKNDWRFGANFQLHSNNPGRLKGAENTIQYNKNQGIESGIYASNDWKATDKIKINYGLRLTNFSVLGGEFYKLDNKREITDTIKVNGIYKNYLNVEPRFSINYKLGANSSGKLGYSRATQNLQIIANSTASSPAERWLMTNNNILPQISDQISLGYVKNSKDKTYEFSVETYYKKLQNQIDYKDGANEFLPEIEEQLINGKGRAYGTEFLLKKNRGKFTGWVGYTLSRTERQIDGINNNKWYPSRQDKTHVINLVMLYELNKKWNFSLIWTYQTGNAATFPVGKYTISVLPYWLYEGRNQNRIPDFHRLDVGANYIMKKSGKFSYELNFSLYNLYARDNPYLILFEQSEKQLSKTVVNQLSLFRIVPAVTLNFKF
jgi:hypothetical protein